MLSEGLAKLGRENFLVIFFLPFLGAPTFFRSCGDSDYNVRVGGAPVLTQTTTLGLEVDGVYHLSTAFVEYFLLVVTT